MSQMDLQTLSNLFATTYNPDPNVRKAAELQIRKVTTVNQHHRELAWSNIPLLVSLSRSESRKA